MDPSTKTGSQSDAPVTVPGSLRDSAGTSTGSPWHWIHQSEQGLVQCLCVIQQSPDLKGLALHVIQQHPVGLGQRVIQQHPSVKGFEPILGSTSRMSTSPIPKVSQR